MIVIKFPSKNEFNWLVYENYASSGALIVTLVLKVRAYEISLPLYKILLVMSW